MGDAAFGQFADVDQAFDGIAFEASEGAEVDQFSDGAADDLADFIAVGHGFPRFRQQTAQAETAGIRGPQNILYPWDTRFPINQIGIILATLGKSLVANETADGKLVEKLAGCEVRYNSQKYVEHIARIQAAQGIRTYVPKGFGTLPIWMASFLIFMLDLDGGEHVTSSHSVSTKNATKDLNNQGSQYLPEESMQFVNKIEDILKTAETDGYPIQFSAITDEHIDFERLDELHDGVQLYLGYLKSGVATDANLNLIREVKPADCRRLCRWVYVSSDACDL